MRQWKRMLTVLVWLTGLFCWPSHTQGEAIDLSLLADPANIVLQPNGTIAYGPDLGEQNPAYGIGPHTAYTVDGTSPPAVAVWASLYRGSSYTAEGTYRVSVLDAVVGSKQCGGLVLLATDGGKALYVAGCEAKTPDTLEIGIVDLSTGTLVQLAATPPGDFIPQYGYHTCDHHTDQDYHQACQWYAVVATLTVNPDGTLTVLAQVFLRGEPSQGMEHASRNDPTYPGYLVKTLTWTGAWPNGVATSGYLGVINMVWQGKLQNSMFGLFAEAESAPPPDCSHCPPECMQ